MTLLSGQEYRYNRGDIVMSVYDDKISIKQILGTQVKYYASGYNTKSYNLCRFLILVGKNVGEERLQSEDGFFQENMPLLWGHRR